MSWSSAASAPGFCRASGRARGEQRSWSPMAYWQGPMAYEPPVYCECKCEPRRKAPRWISWSRQNPGRRYYACLDALHGGCGFVQWHDPAPSRFLTELLGDLRDEVWRMKYGNCAGIEDVGVMPEEEEEEDEGAPQWMLMYLEDQLKEKNAQIDAMKYKYMAVVFVFMVLLVGVVLGKMSV